MSTPDTDGPWDDEDVLLAIDIAERYYQRQQRKLTIANENCSVPPGVGEGQGITMEWADGVTIRHNKFKEIVWHYLQGGGGPEGVRVENNLFEGPIPGGRPHLLNPPAPQVWGAEHAPIGADREEK